MSGYIQHDGFDIKSVSAKKVNENDIEIDDIVLKDIYSNRIQINDYFINGNELRTKELIIGKELDQYKELEIINDYRLDIKSLNILIIKENKTITFILPPDTKGDYYEESFTLKINDNSINVKISDFNEEVFSINIDVDESDVFSISDNVNNVNLITMIKNTRVAKKSEERIFGDKDSSILSNVINVIRKDGKILIPPHLRDKVAYYVNIDNRNEIVDVTKTEMYIDDIPETIILIEDYELKVY